MPPRPFRMNPSRSVLTLLTACLLPVLASASTTITYTVEEPGRVSMGVYDEKGALVRTLMNAKPHETGEHRIAWDGRDATGKPLPVGTYQWRMIRGQGFTPHYLTMLGLPEGQFHWPGGHSGPNGLDRVGDTIYMAAGIVEGSPQYVAWNMDTGDVEWYQMPFGGFQWASDIAASSQYVYPVGMVKGMGEMAILKRGSGGYVSGWANWKRLNRTSHPVGLVELGMRPSQDLPNIYKIEEGQALSDHTGWIKPEGISHVRVGDEMGQGTVQPTGPRMGKFRFKNPLKSPQDIVVRFGNPSNAKRTIRYKIHGTGIRRAKFQEVTLGPGDIESVKLKGGTHRLRIDIGNPEGEAVGWALLDVELRPWGRQIAAHQDKVALLHPGNVVTLVDPLHGTWDDKQWRIEKRPLQTYFKTKFEHSIHVDTESDAVDVDFLPDGTLAVLTNDQVVSVSLNGAIRPLISGLDHAQYFDVDRDTGEVFIAQLGESHQVLKYSPSFELVKTYGREGGRQQGRYVPTDFLEVTAIVGDGRGGFVVGEGKTGPVRTAHFNSEGEMVNQWLGGLSFFTHSWVDPKTHRAWIDAGHGWVTEYDFDYETGKHSVHATYKVNNFGNDHINTKNIQRTGYKGFHVRHKDGRKFLCNIHTLTVIEIDEEAREARPVSIFQKFAHNKYTIEEDKVPPSIGFQEARKNNYLGAMWNDLNHDGEVQDDEVEPSVSLTGSMAWVGDDLSYYFHRGKTALRLEPRWVDGLPVYPAPSEEHKIPVAGSWRDESGNFYRHYKGGHDKKHGFGWPSTMAAANVGLLKYAPDGTQLFDVGTKAATWPGTHPRGQLHFPVLIPGLAKGAVGVSERSGAPVKFWTQDGLYMGHLLDNRPDDDVPDLAYHWHRVERNKPDSFGPGGNQALFQADMAAGGRLVEVDGEAYYFGAGWNSVPVYRVEGFEDFKRSKGSIDLATTASPIKLEGDGLNAMLYADGDFDGRPDATAVVGRIKGNMDPHGGWPRDEVEELLEGNRDRPREVDYKKAGVAYEGWLMPPMTADYQFLVYGGGQFRVWIDGKPLWDNFEHKHNKRSPWVKLEAGQPVKIRLENKGSKKISLSWENPEIDVEFIETKYWYTEKPR